MGATASKGSNAHSVGKHVSENVATRALGGAADFAQSGVMGLAEQLKKIDLSKVAGTVDDAILHKIKNIDLKKLNPKNLLELLPDLNDYPVHEASSRGDIETVCKAMDTSMHPALSVFGSMSPGVLESVTRIMLEQRNKDGLTPLMVAAANDHLELVQHFVKLGSDPAYRDSSAADKSLALVQSTAKNVLQLKSEATEYSLGRNAMHWACVGGSGAVMQELVEACKGDKCALLLAKDDLGTTPLHLACEFQRLDCVQWYLENAYISPQDLMGLLSAETCPPKEKTYRLTPLMAVSMGPPNEVVLSIAQALVSKARTLGMNIEGMLNHRTKPDGMTPLVMAVRGGHAPLVSYLETMGAARAKEGENKHNELGYSMLLWAVRSGSVEVFEQVLAHGWWDGATVLREKLDDRAASDDKLRAISHLLAKQRASEGRSLLQLAAGWGQADMIKYLVSKHHFGMNDRASTKGLWTPLHFASYYGHKDAVRMLLDLGADRTCKTLKGRRTPLAMAQEMGHTTHKRVKIARRRGNKDADEESSRDAVKGGKAPSGLASGAKMEEVMMEVVDQDSVESLLLDHWPIMDAVQDYIHGKTLRSRAGSVPAQGQPNTRPGIASAARLSNDGVAEARDQQQQVAPQAAEMSSPNGRPVVHLPSPAEEELPVRAAAAIAGSDAGRQPGAVGVVASVQHVHLETR